MALRIGFDLDGVLADMESELVRQAEGLFGGGITSTAELSSRQQDRLWRHVATVDNFWETLHEIEPGMVARLHALAVERAWEIIFLTKRPSTAGFTAQRQSQRWLEAKGFMLPSVFVVQGSRGRIADALDLDLIVDDRPENCLDAVKDSRARAVLVWRVDEKELPSAITRLGIGLAASVGACLDVLVQIDTPDAEPKGIVARVMRVLGR